MFKNNKRKASNSFIVEGKKNINLCHDFGFKFIEIIICLSQLEKGSKKMKKKNNFLISNNKYGAVTTSIILLVIIAFLVAYYTYY